MLRSLHVPHRFWDADLFGSFHIDGKQYCARGLLGVCKFLGPRQFFWFLHLGYLMFLRPLPRHEGRLPFDLWLERKIDVKRNPRLFAFFERISRFALSLELSQVSTEEVIRTTKNMFRHNAPAIVEGGCGEVTRQLEQYILEQQGEIRLSCSVVQILHEEGHVTGVRVYEKASGEEAIIKAPLVVSDIGPRATNGLLRNQRVTQAEVLRRRAVQEDEESDPDFTLSEAVGLKVHLLSDISLVPHKGIMYCLDTQRIAGIVQPTNSDPHLAPAGKHLLISHQVIQSDNIEEERALALADLRMLIGEAFDTHCRVLTTSMYRGEWPVNRIVQGEDTAPETAIQGLYLVGDAVKPSGYLMVEGVAQSVNRLLDLLEADAHTHHVTAPPSWLNILKWLWKAPGNSGKVRGERAKWVS
jgi:hypothetical protein